MSVVGRQNQRVDCWVPKIFFFGDRFGTRGNSSWLMTKPEPRRERRHEGNMSAQLKGIGQLASVQLFPCIDSCLSFAKRRGRTC